MRLDNFLNENMDDDEKSLKQIEKGRKQSKISLRNSLRKLDDNIDVFVDQIEKEIEKIEDNPVFQQKLYQMLSNLDKETGEFILALRQIVHALGSASQFIPRSRGHAKGAIPDKKVDIEDTDMEEEEESDE